jgi:hypothetical protein
MDDAQVIVQNKVERGFLFLFFGVIGILAGVRGITGDGTAALVLGIIFVNVGVVCAGAWFWWRGRPPGRIEVTSGAITKWNHSGDKFERITPGPIRVYDSRLQGQSTGWNLEPVGRPLEVGTAAAGVQRTTEMPISLLGYHPFELQDVCARYGWTLVDRDGNPVN